MSTLGVEMSQRHKKGEFTDRRFGENDETVSHEDKMLIRFQRTKQRQLVNEKKQQFNLQSDDDDDGEETILTHRGKRLDEIDYGVTPGMIKHREMDEAANASASEDEFAELRGEGPAKSDFGGMTLKSRPTMELDEDGDPNADVFKTKAEVMQDLIAKSKMYRYEKQKDRAERSDQIEALDEGFDELREILGLDKAEVRAIRKQQKQQMEIAEEQDGSDAEMDESDSFDEDMSDSESESRESGSSGSSESEKTEKRASAMDVDDEGEMDEYDLMVKRISAPGVRKARPSDALLTEEHIAKAERERLWQLERQRVARMNAKLGPEEEEEGKPSRPQASRVIGGDDLDDDFSSQWLPKGGDGDSDGDDDDDDEEDGEEEEISYEEDGESGDDDDAEDDDSDQSDDGDDEKPRKKAKFEEVATDFGSPEDLQVVSQLAADAELPYALAMPKDYESFSALISNQSPHRQATLIGRLRACHHISLSPANRSRLQNLLRFLWRRVLDVGLIWAKELPTLSGIHTLPVIAPSVANGTAETPSKKKKSDGKSSKTNTPSKSDPQPENGVSKEAEQEMQVVTKLLNLLEVLIRPIFEMSAQLSEFALQAAKETLLLLEQAHLKRLSHLSTNPDASVAPTFSTLCFVQVCGVIFSATDRRHALMSPLIIHILHLLGTCRMRNAADIQRCVLLVNETLQFVAPAKRFASEPFSLLFFIIKSFLVDNEVEFTPSIFDAFSPLLYMHPGLLKLKDKKNAKSAQIQTKSTLPMLATRESDPKEKKGVSEKESDCMALQALHTALSVLNTFFGSFSTDVALVSLFVNARRLISALPESLLPDTTAKLRQYLIDTCSRVEKANGQLRMPLQQFAKVVEPLPSLTPDFDDSYFGEKMTSDKLAKETKRMKRKIKSEQKGAEKELRKDTKFIQQQKTKQRAEKLAERRQSSNSTLAMLEQQQSEMNKEANAREKRKKR